MLAGRRVLMLNAIRLDIASGGATVTRQLLERCEDQADALRVVALGPSGSTDRPTEGRLGKLLDIVKCLPGALTIPLRRRLHWVWLEFLSRASPFLLLNCLWQRWVWRPEVVILNQHASFIYAWVFRGLTRIYIWHDVPSAKRGAVRSHPRRHARITAALERAVTAPAAHHFTLSFTETRRLLRLYGIRAGTLPALRRRDLPAPIRRGYKWLMVGNWDRTENAHGALLFLSEVARSSSDAAVVHCVVAGAGAERFVQGLPADVRDSARLQLEVVPRFKDWSDFSDIDTLVAPIHMGAGIKLKTLEAWLWDLPVLGTAQAFSGMPQEVWTLGGHCLPDIPSLAGYCLRTDARMHETLSLRGQAALLRYWDLTA